MTDDADWYCGLLDELKGDVRKAIEILGPTAPSCCGCNYEWSEALRILKAALDD